MAYYDQYNSRNDQATYPPQQRYGEQQDAPFNPYDNTQPHQTYEQGGYGYQEGNYGGYRDEPAGSSAQTLGKPEKSVFENDAYVANARPREPRCVANAACVAADMADTAVSLSRTTQGMKRWRYEHQGNLWTRGSAIGICARFFFCLLFLFLFFFISVVLSLLLVRAHSLVRSQLSDAQSSGFNHPIS